MRAYRIPKSESAGQPDCKASTNHIEQRNRSARNFCVIGKDLLYYLQSIDKKEEVFNNLHITKLLKTVHARNKPMSIRLTYCSICTRRNSEFFRTISRLRQEHPNELVVVELNCMAACDDEPAVILGNDYLPHVSPADLRARIKAQLVN